MLIRGRKARGILTFLTSSVYPHNCLHPLEHCSLPVLLTLGSPFTVELHSTQVRSTQCLLAHVLSLSAPALHAVSAHCIFGSVKPMSVTPRVVIRRTKEEAPNQWRALIGSKCASLGKELVWEVMTYSLTAHWNAKLKSVNMHPPVLQACFIKSHLETMPRHKLTDAERGLVVGCYLEGTTQTQIATKMGKPCKTIRDVIRRYCTDGKITKTPHSGQPRKLSKHDERTLVRKSRLSAQQRRQPLAELCTSFPDILVRTVLWTLSQLRLIAHWEGLWTPNHSTPTAKYVDEKRLEDEAIFEFSALFMQI
jgi:transposase